MLHLSTIRQHYDMGFKSVVSLVEQLEDKIESLSLAQESPAHFNHLQQTISHQQNEIQRLSAIIENKSNELFKLNQDHHQAQNKLQLRLSKARQLNRQLRVRISELEYLLASSHTLTPQLDSHNSNLPPSLDPPWNKAQRTRSLRTKTGSPAGGQLGHSGRTLLQVDNPDLVIVHPVNVCSHCHNSLVPVESRSFQKRQIFEIENGKLTVIEHRIEIKACWVCLKLTKAEYPPELKAPVQYGASVFSRIV